MFDDFFVGQMIELSREHVDLCAENLIFIGQFSEFGFQNEIIHSSFDARTLRRNIVFRALRPIDRIFFVVRHERTFLPMRFIGEEMISLSLTIGTGGRRRRRSRVWRWGGEMRFARIADHQRWDGRRRHYYLLLWEYEWTSLIDQMRVIKTRRDLKRTTACPPDRSIVRRLSGQWVLFFLFSLSLPAMLNRHWWRMSTLLSARTQNESKEEGSRHIYIDRENEWMARRSCHNRHT